MTATTVDFVAALVDLAYQKGARRIRVEPDGAVEVEMAVVRNPLAEQKELELKAVREKGLKGDQPPPRRNDWMDAMGNAEPVVRKTPKPGDA